MNSCANCGLCYVDPNNEGYRCMRGIRQPIKDLFVLGRVVCGKYVQFELILEDKR